MTTKAQREARRRYALKKVRELTQASKLAMADIADILNENEIPTPLGTTEWTARLVSALLICQALEYETDSDWLGQQQGHALLWTLNSEEVLSIFEINFRIHDGTWYQEMFYWTGVDHLVGAFRALYGELFLTEAARAWELSEDVEVGSIPADTMVSLPPEVEAYRDYALDVIREWCHGPRSLNSLASLLTRRGIPTPDGKTTWRHNQVERLIATSDDPELQRLVTPQREDTDLDVDRWAPSDSAEHDAADAQDAPF